MAAAELRDELTCCICMEIYKDPVTLTCGHSYCQLCITKTWDNQEERESSCPECRHRFRVKPELKKTRILSNIANCFKSALTTQDEVRIPCTYCDFPVPASKTCLLCKVSLCDKHLSKHSKSPEHVLTEPTTLPEHEELGPFKVPEKYYSGVTYCSCVYCKMGREHRVNRIEIMLKTAKNKEKLRKRLRKLISQREEVEKKVRRFQDYQKRVKDITANQTERVTALIRVIKEQVEALEKRVLMEISRQEEQVSLRVSNLIKQLEMKKEKLSRKMSDIEELCNTTNPLTVIQERKLDRADYFDTDEGDNDGPEGHGKKNYDDGDLDVELITVTLQSGLTKIVTELNKRRHVQDTSDMLLDVNTAGNNVSVSLDLKTVSWSEEKQTHPKTPERFEKNQVLSITGFSSGQHYWEVEVSILGVWEVGIAYPRIARRGRQSKIGKNNKSWGLRMKDNNPYSMIHDGKKKTLSHHPSCNRLGIFLDYEAGRLSFYELCGPIKHLHTFIAAFTEPLHAVLSVCYYNSVVSIK
uniref:Uncharacterized protein n=1 Tax=Leptobrachium leishanense TaxID=445787 RepID=A0A8C5MST3_9ANUR